MKNLTSTLLAGGIEHTSSLLLAGEIEHNSSPLLAGGIEGGRTAVVLRSEYPFLPSIKINEVFLLSILFGIIILSVNGRPPNPPQAGGIIYGMSEL